MKGQQPLINSFSYFNYQLKTSALEDTGSILCADSGPDLQVYITSINDLVLIT